MTQGAENCHKFFIIAFEIEFGMGILSRNKGDTM
jgi:hypothetical protein